MTNVTLSHQQQAVIDWVTDDTGSLNVVARAGCGKTFTLRQVVLAIRRTTPDAEVFVGAFNKAIVGEVSAAIRKDFNEAGIEYNWKTTNVSTMHSAGLSAWKRSMVKFGDDSINANKTLKIMDDMVRVTNNKEQARKLEALTSTVSQAVSLAKQRGAGFLFDRQDRRQWFDIFDHFGINDLPDGVTTGEAVEVAIEVLTKSASMDKHVIDFDDMILAPLLHGARIWPKDWVLIDEAQDTNPIRRALALALLKPRTGRMIAVGDPRQAIYGFTGADHTAMDIIAEALGSKTLPLNQTYRCPRAVVEFANRWVPDIVAMPSAPEGVVRRMYGIEAFIGDTPGAGDAILCRVNAPLVSTAYALIRQGIACRIEGREIAKGLVKLARKWKIKTTAELGARLNGYEDREVQKWAAKENNNRVQAVIDQVATLGVIIERANASGDNTIDGVVKEIERMFADDIKDVLVLASIHKSKGREWERVYWLNMEVTCPSPWAKQAWELGQEENLMYVATTRAASELVFLDIDQEREGE